MTDKELLDLYREKRAVDGLTGRDWDAQKHLQYDKEIELEGSRPVRDRDRDYLRIGITEKHDFDKRENDISNAAGQLYFKQREIERAEAEEMEEIRKKIVPATHTGRLAKGGD